MTRIIDNKVSNQLIKDTILKQIIEPGEYPYFYSVLQFGFYDNLGYKLPYSEIAKFWDKTEVKRTNRLIKNMLSEAFGIECFWFFIERHAPLWDEHGDITREGRFHVNIITTQIKDSFIENPNRKCRKLMLEDDGSLGVPIQNRVYTDISDFKISLFNACCRKSNWVNRYNYAIKTQILWDPTDIEATVGYCLKDFSPKKGTDFMDIVDFENSDFHNPNN
jgi:hypothetical protein